MKYFIISLIVIMGIIAPSTTEAKKKVNAVCETYEEAMYFRNNWIGKNVDIFFQAKEDHSENNDDKHRETTIHDLINQLSEDEEEFYVSPILQSIRVLKKQFSLKEVQCKSLWGGEVVKRQK